MRCTPRQLGQSRLGSGRVCLSLTDPAVQVRPGFCLWGGLFVGVERRAGCRQCDGWVRWRGVLKPPEAEDRQMVASLAPKTPKELQACGERLRMQTLALTPAEAIDNKITNLQPKHDLVITREF